MLNLEQSIAEWRRQMLAAGVNNADVVDELENHLREDVARQVQLGESPELAFETAVQRIGHAGSLKREFAKLGGKKCGLLRKLKFILLGSFVPFPSLSTFAPSARRTLELARTEAPRLHHDFVGTEHVLLGLLALENGAVANVLKSMGVDCGGLRRQIENLTSHFPLQKTPAQLPYTPRVQKALRIAAQEAKAGKHACVSAEHIFLGLLLEGDGLAARILKNFGVNIQTARQQILIEMGRNPAGA
jgi:hypothetical protein